MEGDFCAGSAQLVGQVFGLIGLDDGILNAAENQDGRGAQAVLRAMVVSGHAAHEDGAGPAGAAVEQQMHRDVRAIGEAGDDKRLLKVVAAGGGACECGQFGRA